MTRFYRKSLRAAGVEAIPGAGPARTTSYRSLPSKDELAAEWLRVRDLRFWQRWEAMARRHLDNPRKQLKTAFTLLAQHVSEPAARGCGMANAAAGAIAGNDHPARRAIEAHKAKLRAKLTELCVRSGAREPDLLAEQLFLLMDGAQATLILGVQAPGRNVGPAAASLIDSCLGGEPS